MKKGSFTIRLKDGRRVTQGDEFEADEAIIPALLRGYFETVHITTPVQEVVIENIVEAEPEMQPEVLNVTWKIEETSPGWYKITDMDGNDYSEKKYRLDEANKKLDELNNV